MLSHIQNLIISKIMRQEGARYSDAIPEGVDKDLFNYHLRFLIDKKYITKSEELYFLTDFGEQYSIQLDALGNYKNLFRASVLAYVTRVNDGKLEILLHKRLRQPYYGDIASISGKLQFGEKIEDAASRKLLEETELICNNFRLFGVHRKMRKNKEGKLIEDTLYHCCIGREPEGVLKQKTIFGENFWSSLDDAIKFQNENITASPKTEEVLLKIHDDNLKEFFYFQEEMTLARD